jgi:DNA topoisomerase III
LRDIEHQKYDPASFIEELKEQMNQIVQQVLSDNSNRRVCVTTKEDLKKRIVQKSKAKATQKAKDAKKETKEQSSPSTNIAGTVCPQCKEGIIIKGKSAYGCSNWKNGCNYRIPFEEK